MSSSRTDPRRKAGWRTSHLLLATLVSFLVVLTTSALLLLRYSAMQPSVRQQALPLATMADLIDAADAGSVGLAQQTLARQAIARQPAPPEIKAALPIPFLEALARYLRESTGREVQVEQVADGTPRLWLKAARGDWIGVPLEPMRSLVARFALLVMLMALLMAIAAAWWLSRRLAGPIERLASVAGRLPEPVAPEEFRVGGPREVRLLGARLADALNRIESQRRERDLMLAGLSHDLRTPLMRLLLRVDLIDGLPEGEREAIGAEIAELDRRIDRFIEHARTGAEEPFVELDLVAMLRAEIAASEQRGYAWQSRLPASATVRGQPGVLGRLIANLVDNAEQHGAAPFALSLDPEVTEQSGARVRLRVSNGMDDEIKACAAAVPHRGFGLALCRNIAESHGGELAGGHDGDSFVVSLILPQLV